MIKKSIVLIEKELKLKNIVEEIKVLKNKDVKLLFYYGYVLKNKFYLIDEKYINKIMNLKI